MSLKGQEFISKQQMLVAIREVNPQHEMGQAPKKGNITDAYRNWISEHPELAASINANNFGSLAVRYGICSRGVVSRPTDTPTPKLGLISRIEELERIVMEQQEFIDRLKGDLYSEV